MMNSQKIRFIVLLVLFFFEILTVSYIIYKIGVPQSMADFLYSPLFPNSMLLFSFGLGTLLSYRFMKKA